MTYLGDIVFLYLLLVVIVVALMVIDFTVGSQKK